MYLTRSSSTVFTPVFCSRFSKAVLEDVFTSTSAGHEGGTRGVRVITDDDAREYLSFYPSFTY